MRNLKQTAKKQQLIPQVCRLGLDTIKDDCYARKCRSFQLLPPLLMQEKVYFEMFWTGLLFQHLMGKGGVKNTIHDISESLKSL